MYLLDKYVSNECIIGLYIILVLYQVSFIEDEKRIKCERWLEEEEKTCNESRKSSVFYRKASRYDC
jgi:hypothetical protein